MISSVCVWVVKLENMERIADDLYFVKYIHREGSFVGITVVLGRQTIGLVDTGFEATIETALFPFLQDVERSPDEIDVVVNTHRDGDHFREIQSLRAAQRRQSLSPRVMLTALKVSMSHYRMATV
jgi:glyoxylase-like metal-dependent hydrolase (beta-lactamase superfamily II)